MLGSINDPEDGKSVAATVFGAVVVYIVSSPLLVCLFCRLTTTHRASSCSAPAKPGSTAGSVLSSYTNSKLLARSLCFFIFSSLARLYWEQELELALV